MSIHKGNIILLNSGPVCCLVGWFGPGKGHFDKENAIFFNGRARRVCAIEFKVNTRGGLSAGVTMGNSWSVLLICKTEKSRGSI